MNAFLFLPHSSVHCFPTRLSLHSSVVPSLSFFVVCPAKKGERSLFCDLYPLSKLHCHGLSQLSSFLGDDVFPGHGLTCTVSQSLPVFGGISLQKTLSSLSFSFCSVSSRSFGLTLFFLILFLFPFSVSPFLPFSLSRFLSFFVFLSFIFHSFILSCFLVFLKWGSPSAGCQGAKAKAKESGARTGARTELH